MGRRFCLIIFFLALSAAFCPGAYGQLPPESAVDRATREVDRPIREEAEEKLMAVPKKIPKVKEGEEEKVPEGPKFFVKKINLVGTVSVSPDEFKPIIEKYENKDNSLGELNILAREIEREYLRKGIIAACFIPPQDVKEGVVTLRVVEAKMGALQIKDHNFFDKEWLAQYWTIKPGEVLRYDKMSRSVQLMNKNPDRDVNATLHAGKKPETTDVLLNVKTRFPIHVFYSLDREGAVSTGRLRHGFGVRDNNFLFVDDTLLVGGTIGKDFSGYYAYHSIPISNFGTSVMYGYSSSKSQPKKEFTGFGIRSHSENTSCYVHQDLYKKAEYVGEVSLGMDANDKTTVSNSGTLTRDRFRIARIKSTLIHRYPGCITYMTPEFSQGLHILGARSKNPLSSRNGGADDNFSKIRLSIRHKRALPLNLQASLDFQCQHCSEKLASQEQFSLGGIDSVRGYPSQDYMADSGFLSRCELQIPSFWIPDNIKIPYAPQPLKKSVTGLIFFDQGYGERRGAIRGQERASVYYVGIGAGLRIRLFNQALLRLEWGFPVGDRPITEAENSRLHFSLNFEDRFPEEFERISNIIHEDSIKNLAWKLLNDEMRRPESALGKKMYAYLSQARTDEEKGNFEKAKLYYEKIRNTGNSLYAQSEKYVRDCFEQEKKLKKYSETAMKYYEEGKIEKAKELWGKIEKEAKVKPLVLEL